MVVLDKTDSFQNPQPEPHNFNVVKLETQYRSIKSIGEVVSQFTYNGILKHNRENSEQQKMEVNGFHTRSLNVIKFPVSKYESIYRPKRINKSPVQIYSAIFTFEFVKHISSQITHGTKERPYKIGIISPYRIQTDIINKLLSQYNQPENITIQVGTVHGFQGDECDVILALFNPPPKINGSSESFVNKQNILNVAISRAKDYLFVLMPDENTEDIGKLFKINKIEGLSKSDAGNYISHKSGQIEMALFGDEKHIEKITYSTTHQNVNVYARQEKVYEVRSDDFAVDIQIKAIE